MDHPRFMSLSQEQEPLCVPLSPYSTTLLTRSLISIHQSSGPCGLQWSLTFFVLSREEISEASLTMGLLKNYRLETEVLTLCIQGHQTSVVQTQLNNSLGVLYLWWVHRDPGRGLLRPSTGRTQGSRDPRTGPDGGYLTP